MAGLANAGPEEAACLFASLKAKKKSFPSS